MKQLLVLSGKGGTGKTTITRLLIPLLNAKKYADCDVDAPNLHLAFQSESKPITKNLYGMKKAQINTNTCIQCGKCQNYCRFDAIYLKNNQYTIDSILCEGCSVCDLVCPVEAIEMVDNINGTLFNYQTDESFLTTATLSMGSGNSGFLVSEVKEQLKQSNIHTQIEIIDGSPGIGCPVIASITGVDLVLIVAEPSISGFEDMKRVVEVTKRMKVNLVACVNKYDINETISSKIESYCSSMNIPFLATIPYDKELGNIAEGNPVQNYSSPGYASIKGLSSQILTILTK